MEEGTSKDPTNVSDGARHMKISEELIAQLDAFEKDKLAARNLLRQSLSIVDEAVTLGKSRGEGALALPPLPPPDSPAHVVFLRGLPGSGKSTWAVRTARRHPSGTVTVISIDDISTDDPGDDLEISSEIRIARLKVASLEKMAASLKNPLARLVIVDGPNINSELLSQQIVFVAQLGASPSVNSSFLSVPKEECLRRNTLRTNPVPQQIIYRMAERIEWEKTKSLQ